MRLQSHSKSESSRSLRPTPWRLSPPPGTVPPNRFLEFFTAQIRNPHTRRAYVRAVGTFCAWLETHGVPSIAAVGSIHIAAYVEDLGHRQSAPTVKQAPRRHPDDVRLARHRRHPAEGVVQKLRSFCTAVCTTVTGGT
jgi:hypothetical protein